MSQKVLIIDDGTPVHDLIKARLAGEPVELFSALDSATGLEMARQLEPDLVLLDVAMPDIDGFEICRRLKGDPATMSIPIVFLTGATSTQEKIRGLDLGAVDYVQKPFDSAELRARVRASLRTKYLLDLLANKAQVDGLTGLWNRAYFEQTLLRQLALRRRYGQPLACILVDIDQLGVLNDRFGHPFGDEVIRTVADVLLSSCRTEDLVCRYGGEEFGILAPNTPGERAMLLAERLRQAVALRVMDHRGQRLTVTCSFGVADAEAAQGIVVEATDALERAKAGGRNRVEAALVSAMAVDGVSM
jgi:two-component system cell cycle response regulator